MPRTPFKAALCIACVSLAMAGGAYIRNDAYVLADGEEGLTETPVSEANNIEEGGEPITTEPVYEFVPGPTYAEPVEEEYNGNDPVENEIIQEEEPTEEVVDISEETVPDVPIEEEPPADEIPAVEDTATEERVTEAEVFPAEEPEDDPIEEPTEAEIAEETETMVTEAPVPEEPAPEEPVEAEVTEPVETEETEDETAAETETEVVEPVASEEDETAAEPETEEETESEPAIPESEPATEAATETAAEATTEYAEAETLEEEIILEEELIEDFMLETSEAETSESMEEMTLEEENLDLTEGEETSEVETSEAETTEAETSEAETETDADTQEVTYIVDTVGHTILAENATTYIVNGKEIDQNMFQTAPDECWSYAQSFYNYLWGAAFTNNRFSEDSLLCDMQEEDMLLTPEHLQEYISKSPLGAVIRICNEENLSGNDSKGHSQLLVQRDENGFTVIEGGSSIAPHHREHYYTWESYCASWQYKFIKYIKAPAEAWEAVAALAETENSPQIYAGGYLRSFSVYFSEEK